MSERPELRSLSRRSFVRTTVSAVGAGATIGAPGLILGPRGRRGQAANTIFRGGSVYDGTGVPPVRADVAVVGDRVVEIGRRIPGADAVNVDLDGLALAPGFIDIHSHTDFELLINPRADGKVRQGVTTEVAGQDGNSIGPWGDEQFETVRDTYRSRYGITIDFRDLTGLFRRLERQNAAVNFASMIGHGTIRGYVVGNDDRPATEAELVRMVSLVREALEAGACGLSTGLEYVPGAWADFQELVRLAEPLHGTGLPYTSHLRNEDDQLFGAVEEALNVGRKAGVPVQISHLKAQGKSNWWKAEPVLEMLQSARADGVDVTYDRYPYVAYSTGLSSLFPVWARAGGTDALLARLDDPEISSRIERAVRDKVAKLGSWDAIQVTSTASEGLAWARGRRLGRLATERGADPYEQFLRIVRGDRNRSGMVGFGMSEENTARFLTHPLGMICSDGAALATTGPLSTGTPHPRHYGTFPRVLGHYCRDQNLMPLELGVHKMTGMPAARLRLRGRGIIAPGAFADLVAFDPDRVADRATFEAPHRYPVGITDVMVNGIFVLREGEHTGATPGRVISTALRS